jgi:hypothetical protein
MAGPGKFVFIEYDKLFFYFNIVLLDMVLLIADDVAGSP